MVYVGRQRFLICLEHIHEQSSTTGQILNSDTLHMITAIGKTLNTLWQQLKL
jgi:hypothetical protein